MKPWILALAGLLAGSIIGCTSVPAAPACDLAIENVNVIPMDRDQVLPNRTVLITGGRVAAIVAGDSSGAQCASRIGGGGRYLMPGLNDMHVHVEASAFVEAFGLPPTEIPFEDVLFPYLANGVTGVRVMSGSPDLLAFRASAHGPGPRLAIASPMLSGEPPILPEPAVRILKTPDEARAAVAEYAAAGYDLIKIRGNLERPVLEAVFDASAVARLDVDGHIPNLKDWTEEDIFSGRQRGVAHLDELALRIEKPDDIDRFAAALRKCRCTVTSTMNVEKSAAEQLRDFDATAARDEIRYVHPLLRRAFWARERNPYLAEGADPGFFDQLLDLDMQLARALDRHGVTLLAGTDALSPMIIPGASLPDELALLVKAGLTPFAALSAATRTPAETTRAFSDIGVLAPGRTANAILVRQNPLKDVAAVRRPDAVIIEGRYISRKELDARMEEIAEAFAKL